MQQSIIAEQLNELIAKSRPVEVGLAACRLDGEEELLINADRPFHPASTIKLCVMMEAFRQVQAGEIALDELVPIRNEFRSLADGSPYSLQAEDDSEKALYGRLGQLISRRDLVKRMITVSSNLATNMLLEELGPKQVTAFMRVLGSDSLRVLRGVEDKQAYRLGLNNAATARGFMNILARLARREVVSAEASDEMIEILAQQQFNEMIPAGLPSDVRVVHKTGWAADYFHDVGIIYPPSKEPFVLCILTKGYEESDEAAAHAFVASLARAVYAQWVAKTPGAKRSEA